MTTALLPDIEAAVIDWLVADPNVTALVSTRVYASPPEGVTYPFIKVFAVTGSVQARHWLATTLLQVEGWAHHGKTTGLAGRAEARDACEAAVASLLDASNTLVGDCWIASVQDVSVARALPDPDTDNHRFMAEVQVTYHPDPYGS